MIDAKFLYGQMQSLMMHQDLILFFIHLCFLKEWRLLSLHWFHNPVSQWVSKKVKHSSSITNKHSSLGTGVSIKHVLLMTGRTS